MSIDRPALEAFADEFGLRIVLDKFEADTGLTLDWLLEHPKLHSIKDRPPWLLHVDNPDYATRSVHDAALVVWLAEVFHMMPEPEGVDAAREYVYNQVNSYMSADWQEHRKKESDRQAERAAKPRKAERNGIIRKLAQYDHSMPSATLWDRLKTILEDENLKPREEATNTALVLHYEDENGDPQKLTYKTFQNLLSQFRNELSR